PLQNTLKFRAHGIRKGEIVGVNNFKVPPLIAYGAYLEEFRYELCSAPLGQIMGGSLISS
ncbi:MAG: hypothetical protein ACE5II_04560, partial [Anaerolineae bacterium]